MKHTTALLLLSLITINHTINAFIIPKFYHGRIFEETSRFSENNLTSLDITVAGGTKHFCQRGYHGRLDFIELISQLYQNMSGGFFLHAAVPVCWIKLNDLERISTDYEPIAHCIHKTAVYSPALLVGWTLNYEDTIYIDFIDATIEIGALLPSPKDAIAVPLFPIGYTQKPGFTARGTAALGALEWLTTGLYGQAILLDAAPIWSSGLFITADHIIPKLSFTLALCGDGQHKQIGQIQPWQMFSVYGSGELDLATDERPWLPRLRAFFSKPVAGRHILTAELGGFNIGIDANIIF